MSGGKRRPPPKADKLVDHHLSVVKNAVAEQGMEQLKKEKKRLEYIIADLLKAGEENKMKIRKISEICNE